MSDKMVINRIPKSIKLDLSWDELKILDRWLDAAAQLSPGKNKSNLMLIILLSKAWMKTHKMLQNQKDKNKVTLTVEEALALHNLIRSSEPTNDIYEYAVMTNIFRNIDEQISNAL